MAGILIPNDGECHLETGEENGSSFYGYFRDPEQVVYLIVVHEYIYIYTLEA